MNLNERAAKCMGWTLSTSYAASDPSNRVYQDDHGRFRLAKKTWNPREDYNHARMLYQRVVETDRIANGDRSRYLTHQVIERLDVDWYNYPLELLEITAEQLTLACCEVLEAHNESH